MLRLFKHNAVIICGHFGTGKTNISVNAAAAAAESKKNVFIADLDIVNPYFRTADNTDFLKSKGVTCLIPPYANTNVDIPSLPASLPLIFNKENYSVSDIGGNEEGAVVLRVFSESYKEVGYDMYYVYNMFRPENIDEEISYASMLSIEASSGLKFSGIINNSNLGIETTPELVKNSIPHAEKFASVSGVPLIMTTAFEKNAFDGCTIIKDITKKLY